MLKSGTFLSTKACLDNTERAWFFFSPTIIKFHLLSYRAIGSDVGDFLLGMLAEKRWICFLERFTLLLKKRISIGKRNKDTDFFICKCIFFLVSVCLTFGILPYLRLEPF